jgi:hypothetical protein
MVDEMKEDDDNKWNDTIKRLLTAHNKNKNMSCVISSQPTSALFSSIDLKVNANYVVILKEPNYLIRKLIYENYACVFESFDNFCQIMDQCTENYECIVKNVLFEVHKRLW